MKKTIKLLGIIALVAVIAFTLVFTTCDNGSGGNNNNSNQDNQNDSSGNGGNGGNNNTGGVTSAKSVQVYNENGTPYTGSGKVSMLIFWEGKETYEESIAMEEEVGNITNGKLSFTLPDIPTSIANKGVTFADLYRDSYGAGGGITIVHTVKSKPNVSSADAKFLMGDDDFEVSLANNDEGWLAYYSVSTDQYVMYLYSDKACTISGVYNETIVFTSSSYSDTYNNIQTWSCSFNKGWNAVYMTDSYTENGSTSTSIGTISTSPIGNATDFKWVLYSGSNSADRQNDDNGDYMPPTYPTTDGRLTITGLGAYNGNYVAKVQDEAMGKSYFDDAGNVHWQRFLYVDNFNDSNDTLISGGSVTLKVWECPEGGGRVSYTGNDQNVTFYVDIFSRSSFDMGGVNDEYLLAEGTVTVNFTNGIGTGTFTPRP